ncbi:MAG: ABC transporter ATP-binding protein [Blastocatellia bacterium]
MKPIIRVENLSKQYRIGAAQTPYKTLRESLTEAVRAPFSRFRSDGNSADNTVWALKDVSFEVMPGEIVGIIGRNGAGKSTLLKILSRITEPTRGKVDLYGRVGSLLEVGTGFHPELTGRENIYLSGTILGMHKMEIVRKFGEIVEFAEVERVLDTPVKYYSSGMYMRLAFAVAAHLETEILVIDEVLAVGDDKFQNKCLGKMWEVANGGRTVLFVSHNMAAISKTCSRAILLDEGRERYQGDIDVAIGIYLQEGKAFEAYFGNEAVRYAAVRQAGNSIEVIVEYEVVEPLTLPNLGFCITNNIGVPVCGTNSRIDKVRRLPSPARKGRVRVQIDCPVLLNGTYRLSLWFGNEVEDYFAKKDCLTFEVINMSDRHHDLSFTLGSVYPKCIWYFNVNA